MVSTVKPRPNHYEMLGLKPTATPEEIRQAFNRELLRPRPFGGLAQLGVAFETLKDPAKRKAYDASIGLTAPPEPPKAPSALQSRLQYIIAPAGAERPAFNIAATQPIRGAVPRAAKPEPAVQPRAPSFIAGPAPEAAKPEVRPEPTPFVSPRPHIPEPRVDPEPEAHLVEDVERSPMISRQVGIAVGGVLLAAVLVGAWAGTSVQNPESPEKAAQAARLTLPPPKPLPGIADPEPAPAAPVTEARADEPARRTNVAAETVNRAMPRPLELTAEEEQNLAGGQFVETATQQIAEASDTPAETATEAPAAVAASMPLPNRVIARTIHRIGYSCGQVASTTALDSPGVFKVTCTSGQSYQATPVRGRYHFRRMGSQ